MNSGFGTRFSDCRARLEAFGSPTDSVHPCQKIAVLIRVQLWFLQPGRAAMQAGFMPDLTMRGSANCSGLSSL